MKESVKPGLTMTRTIEVDEPRTIAFMGEAGRIYGTPFLIQDIESTSHDLLIDHLDEGEETVGTAINIEHMAATPLGAKVDITVTVTAVEGRAITLEVEARDALDTLCRGTHSRFAVAMDKIKDRMKAKMEKLSGVSGV